MKNIFSIILVAFFLIVFSYSVFAESLVFIDPDEGDNFYLGDKVDVRVDIEDDSYTEFDFRVGGETICEYGADDFTTSSDEECNLQDSETFTWSGSHPFEESQEYELEFNAVYGLTSAYSADPLTIHITKEPPVIEDEPVYDGNELRWNFNLSDYSLNDDGILEFYDHYEDGESEASCLYSGDDDGCEMTEGGDDDWEYYLTYTGYDEAGNYTPRFYINFDGEDAEDDKISEDGIQVGPEITDFDVDSPVIVNSEVAISFTPNAAVGIDEIRYQWSENSGSNTISGCVSGETCVKKIPTPMLDGTYSLTLELTDNNNMEASETVENIKVEEESEDPEVESITLPDDSVYENEEFMINATISEYEDAGDVELFFGDELIETKNPASEVSFTKSHDESTEDLDVKVVVNFGDESHSNTDTIRILEYIKPKIVNIHTVHNNKIWDGIVADDEHPVYEGMDFRIHVEAEGIDELKLQEPDEGSSCASIDKKDENKMLCSQNIKKTSDGEYSYEVRIGDNVHEKTDSQEYTVTVEEPTPPTVKDLKGGGADGDVFYPTLETNTITATLEKGTFNLSKTELLVDGKKKKALDPEPEGEGIEIQTDALTEKEDDVEIKLIVLDQFGESDEQSVKLSPADYDCFDCNDIAAEDAQDECEEMMEDHDPDTTEQVCSKPIDMNCDGKRLGRGIKEYQCHKINDEGHCDKDLGSSFICEGRFEEKGKNGFWEDCECTPQISIESPESGTTYSPTNLPKIELDTNLRLAGTKPINYRLNDGPVRQYTSPFTARSTIAGTDVLRIEAFMSKEAESILDDDFYVEREVKYDAPEREDPRASEEIQMENTSEEDEEFYESELERTGSDLSELASRADVDKSVESSLTANYYEGRTEMELDLKSGKNLKGTSVVLEIPKCAADLVNEVMFDDTSYEVLQDDPLVAWHFEEMDRDVNLRYEFSKELDPDCIAQMRVMSLVREVGDDRMDSFMRSPLFPLLMIPVVVSVLIYFSRFTTTGKPEQVSESTEQELVKVVQRRVAEGQSDDEVISDLTQEGFDEQEVLKALKEA